MNFGETTQPSSDVVADLTEVVDRTVRVAVSLTPACVLAMRSAGKGWIVTITSLATTGVRERTSHAAAEAAVEVRTRG